MSSDSLQLYPFSMGLLLTFTLPINFVLKCHLFFFMSECTSDYSKTCVKRPLSKRPKIGFQDQYLLDAGKKYCIRLQG